MRTYLFNASFLGNPLRPDPLISLLCYNRNGITYVRRNSTPLKLPIVLEVAIDLMGYGILPIKSDGHY